MLLSFSPPYFSAAARQFSLSLSLSVFIFRVITTTTTTTHAAAGCRLQILVHKTSTVFAAGKTAAPHYEHPTRARMTILSSTRRLPTRDKRALSGLNLSIKLRKRPPTPRSRITRRPNYYFNFPSTFTTLPPPPPPALLRSSSVITAPLRGRVYGLQFEKEYFEILPFCFFQCTRV